MSFWSAIWYRKLIFLKITFKENFIFLKNVIWIYIHSGTPLARPPTGRDSIDRVQGPDKGGTMPLGGTLVKRRNSKWSFTNESEVGLG